MPRPRILMLAWLVAPERGSEWAAAWGMAVAAARIGDVTVLASPDSAASVNRWAEDHPGAGIRAVAVAEASRWWLSLGRRLVRGFFLNYLAWLAAAGAAARRLNAELPFDLAVHAALGCYWLPSPVVDLGVPNLWGPVAGATRAPLALLPVLGWRGMAERAVERCTRAAASRLPATRRTMREAGLVSVESLATYAHLPRHVGARAPLAHRAVLTQLPDLGGRRHPLRDARRVVFPSSLSPGKGGTLAVAAMRHVPGDVRLVFANGGDEHPRLRRLAARLGLGDRVEFLGPVPRAASLELVRGAGAALFAGIHEDGGCALCEAMLLGTPVVALGHGGPKEMVERWCTDRARAVLVPPGRNPAATARAMGEALSALLARAPERDDPYLDQEGAMQELVGCYLDAMRVPTSLGAARRASRPEPAPAAGAP